VKWGSAWCVRVARRRALRQHMLTHSTASALSEYSTIAVVLLSGSPAAAAVRRVSRASGPAGSQPA